MKTILCYGDSNTWGQVPLRQFVKSRHPRDLRWTGRLEAFSGGQLRVIEAGNNGRTTGPEDPVRAGRSGLAYLPACLDSAVPLDLVIFMLGITRSICSQMPGQKTEILLMSPPVIKAQYYGLDMGLDDFKYPEAEAYSRALAGHYEKLARDLGTHFLDSALHVETSPEDGVHLDWQNHGRLADAVWTKVREILKAG